MSFLFRSVLFQLFLGAAVSWTMPLGKTVDSWLSFSALAVVGLFLCIMLEMNFKELKEDLGLGLKVVCWSAAIPFGVYFFLCKIFHLETFSSLTVSTVLVATGTGVTMQTLSARGKLETRTGRFLALVSAVEDIPAAVGMACLLAGKGQEQDHHFLLPFVASAVFFLLLKLFHTKLSHGLHSLVLFCFGVSFAKALEPFHVSLVLGGLLAGFFLSFTMKGEHLAAAKTLKRFLSLPLFVYMFTIGTKLDLLVVKEWENVSFIFFLTLAAVVTKFAIPWVLLGKNAGPSRRAVSWGLVPRGIPGFAFAAAAASQGIIGSDVFSMLVFIVAATTWIGLLGLEFSLKDVS